ncbi:MAG TPA: hypothetical protein VII47_11085 [Actinomycetota bacterium]
MRIAAGQARARVEAHLGRPPQDALEAAVVLEAWGGLRARSALELGESVLNLSARDRGLPGGTAAPPVTPVAPSRGRGLVLAVALLATVTWAAPLVKAFGLAVFQRGWTLALPASLGVQWLLQRRTLGDIGLRGRSWRGWLLLAAPPLAIGATGAVDPAVALAAALALVWASILVVVGRGWGLVYAGVILAGGLLMRLVPLASWDLGLMLAVGAGGLVAAAATRAAPDRRPTPWRLCIPAGLSGATVGVLITLGAGGPVTMTSDVAVLALIPALAGTLWTAGHLVGLWNLTAEPLLGAGPDTVRPRRWAPLARRVLLGAAARLGAATAALSALVLSVALVRHEDVRVVGALLAACSGMALIGLLVALLEAFGRQGWALTTAVLAAAPLVLHELGLGLGSRGASVGASVLVGLVVSAWTIRYFLEDPHRSLVVAAL